jgi:hypothetical protein
MGGEGVKIGPTTNLLLLSFPSAACRSAKSRLP